MKKWKKNHTKSKNHWSMTIWTNLVETYPRHIPTKFEGDPADGFWEEAENGNCGRMMTDRWTMDRRWMAYPPKSSADLSVSWGELIPWVSIRRTSVVVRQQLTFSTSQKPLARSTANLVGMCLGWVSTKFLQMAKVQWFLDFFLNLCGSIFGQILKKSSSL